ncbi:hypothetical protein K435DRAFT_974126 [Dendrothele bispora CBS 962.96]|uniref:Uncharacterized protein n=1 Tax=Dendrothele bispora (strain CBS 962.96) TaxID=1314807 RepID=A0A4S8KNF5_DENBC|nr:hypothetical protein K435DRAFT_974126 [Dendrothele bispora CBS 962.96]
MSADGSCSDGLPDDLETAWIAVAPVPVGKRCLAITRDSSGYNEPDTTLYSRLLGKPPLPWFPSTLPPNTSIRCYFRGMPHRRAKCSVRGQLRKNNSFPFSTRACRYRYCRTLLRGTDLPPPTIKKRRDISNGALPKSLSRVLDAVKTREERKRRNQDLNDVFPTNGQGGRRRKLDGKDDKSKSKKNEGVVTVKGILPGVFAALNVLKLLCARSKDDDDDEDNDDELSDPNHNLERPANDNLKHSSTTLSGKPKATELETYSTSVPRRLNDIAQAPPQLKPAKTRG